MEEEAALRGFAKTGLEGVKKDSALGYAQRAVMDLRCLAWHLLDARQNVWKAVFEGIRPLNYIP